MRVLVDVNIFISALLSPQRDSYPQQIIQAFLVGQFTLILPAELIEELVSTMIKKEYLLKHITVCEAEILVRLLDKFAVFIPHIAEKIPPISRDPKDDYLPAYALVGKADYLVTGDADLLALKKIDRVKVLSPKAFVNLLRQEK